MNDSKIAELIEYWLTTAKHDYGTMLYLYKGKKYADSLFFGHIVLEKVLKSLAVAATKSEASKSHDLVYLAKMTTLSFTDQELEYFKIVNRFNMRSRYPDIKLNFYKQTNEQYTSEHVARIKVLYKSLCQKQKQKK
ncbi:MAG: HEPN domain-containing protein [Candidatus Falkowbacteria bacterium]